MTDLNLENALQSIREHYLLLIKHLENEKSEYLLRIEQITKAVDSLKQVMKDYDI